MPAIAKLFRTAKALPPKERLTAIRKIFHTLLWTAALHHEVEDWPVEKLEAHYGIGHYEDRKALLHDALDELLRKSVDVETVYRILSKARWDLAQWYAGQKELDARRVVETERQTVVPNLQKWTDRWQRLQLLEHEATTMSAQPVARGLAEKLKPRQKARQDSPSRRPARSGSPSPKTDIIRPTLKALAAAGVMGWVRMALLDATGIK